MKDTMIRSEIEKIVMALCMHSQKDTDGKVTIAYEGISPQQATQSLEALINKTNNEARLDELRNVWNYDKDKGLVYLEERIEKRLRKLQTLKQEEDN